MWILTWEPRCQLLKMIVALLISYPCSVSGRRLLSLIQCVWEQMFWCSANVSLTLCNSVNVLPQVHCRWMKNSWAVQVNSTALISDDREKQKHSTKIRRCNKIIHTSISYQTKFQNIGLGFKKNDNTEAWGVFEKYYASLSRVSSSSCRNVERRMHCILRRRDGTRKSKKTTSSSKQSSATTTHYQHISPCIMKCGDIIRSVHECMNDYVKIFKQF